MADDIDALGRQLAEAFGKRTGSDVSMSFGTVAAVHEYTADVKLDVSVYGGTLYGLSMTTACRGASVGDRVIVQTYGHLSVVTGVIAHDNAPYVKVAGDTMNAAGYYGGYITSSGTLLRFSLPCVFASGVSAAASSDWQIYVRADGGYEVGSADSATTIRASNIALTCRTNAHHIDVAITFSTARNNNIAVGVQVSSGSITFS